MKVSVIVVTFNEEKNIVPCLESLQKQDYKHDYEIIIADGNSTDNTKKCCSKHNSETKETE